MFTTYSTCCADITRCINSGTLRSEVAISIYFLCAGIPKAISYAVFFLHWYWFWTCSAHLNKLVVHFLCKCVQPCSLVFFLLELFPWMIYPSSFSIFYYICPMGASVCFNLLSSTFKDDKSNYVDHAIMDSHHVSYVLGLCGCVYRCCLTGSVSSSCMFQRNHVALHSNFFVQQTISGFLILNKNDLKMLTGCTPLLYRILYL